MLAVCEVSFIICRVDIRHKIWQKQHNFALLLNIHIPPTEGLQIPVGGGHLKEMYEMYKVKLVFHRCSGFYQKIIPSMEEVHVWIFYRSAQFWQLHNIHCYSFKIFPRFWLVETTRIIHHNQLLFTKFGKNLRHIESLTSKVEPSKNYWTIDVKMTSKMQPAADYWTVDRENLGTRLCYIWWAEKQRAKWRNSFKNE